VRDACLNWTRIGQGAGPSDCRPTRLRLMDDYGIDLLAEALGSGATNKTSRLGPTEKPRQLFETKDVSSLAKYIKSDACHKIYFMVNPP
jgi:hypothetical protein